jgi:large repetitive protein
MNPSLSVLRRFVRISVAALVIGVGGLATVSTASSSSAIVSSPSIDYGMLETPGNTVSIDVVATNNVPTATIAPITFAEDGPSFVVPITFTDIDGDTVYMTNDSFARNGDLTVNAAGTEATYTPYPNFNGTEYISIDFWDGITFNSTQIFFDIAPVVDPPSVELDSEGPTAAYEDGGLQSFGYRALNPDAPFGVFVVSVTAEHGRVAFASTLGSGFDYTPAPGFFGTDTLTFTFPDPTPVTTQAAIVIAPFTATLSLPVLATPDAPTSSAGPATTNRNLAVDVPVTLADVDGDAVTIVSATAQAGSVSIVGSSLHYVPAQNFSGNDTITYAISDGVGYNLDTRTFFADLSLDATFTVAVTVNATVAVDAPPTASASPSTTLEDTAVDIAVTITDLDSTAGLAISAASAAHGTVAIVGSTLHYTPAADYNGADTITYSVTDGTNTTVGNTVAVTVTAVNDAPVAPADEPATIVRTIGRDTTVRLEVAGGPDADGDSSDVAITTQAVHGEAKVVAHPGAIVIGSAGGEIVYTPSIGFVGNDTFTYTVSDGHGGSYERVVQITVTAPRLPSSGLPVTGSDTRGLLGVGTLATLFGAAFLMVQRRRKI